METVITIIITVLFLIIKFVGKNADKSAKAPVKPVQPSATDGYKTLAEIFPDLRVILEEDSEDHHEALEESEPIMEEKPTYIYKGFKSVQNETKSEVSKTTDVETSEKKEKIDPKKLVLYSEIMNRKY